MEASPALLVANRRLMELRRRMVVQRPHTEVSAVMPLTSESCSPVSATSIVDSLPAHLGWGSTAASEVIRAGIKRRRHLDRETATAFQTPIQSSTGKLGDPPSDHTPSRTALEAVSLPTTVKVYPDIALGMLRQEMAAAGRIWLLLRHLDQVGQGLFRIVNIKQHLTHNKSTKRVCGWRQLRNLLRQGEGVFWQRDSKRIWLRSAAKTAAALGVERLTGRPVSLPVKVLMGGMGDVRAHLYAVYHSGRVKDGRPGKPAKPIARATLEQLSGVTREAQRLYEKRAGVLVQHNYAVGEQSNPERHRERAWQRGGGVFELIDHQGQQGRKGGSYLAWQLPNSYQSAYRQRPKGQQKRINRQLKDLFMKGMTGNSSEAIERRYFDSPAQAVRALGKCAAVNLYWRRHGIRNRGGFIWQVIG